jgi:predicted signal transduction protein with EAL and GGDEF domain
MTQWVMQPGTWCSRCWPSGCRPIARRDSALYRLGGDEFVLLWENAPGIKTISSFCDGLSAFVFRPVESPAGKIDTGGSIGFAITDEQVGSLSDLLKRADLALYQGQGNAGVKHSFFTHEMESNHRHRQKMEAICAMAWPRARLAS